MTGQELYQLGKGSPAAKACIPLELSHTPPRIFYEGTWLAEFWYYMIDYNDESLFEPQFYLLLELPAGNPIRMQRLSDKGCCLGPAPEVVTEEYYRQMNRYLDDCAALLTAEAPAAEQIRTLQQQWLAGQPQVLGRWLSRQALSTQAPPANISHEAGQPPEDLVAYWKQEMAQAVKEGDPRRIQDTQQQLLKAMQRTRR